MTRFQDYMNQVRNLEPTIKINREQGAAIIKAHDVGILNLNAEEQILVDQVMSTIKFEIAD